jgi:hypothetical protein
LAGQDPAALLHCVNAKSGRAALITKGLTMTDDDDRLIQAVRLTRPEKRALAPLKAFEESAWERVEEAAWRAAWAAEVEAADPWVSRELALVTGLLLPIWSSLPSKQAAVRRLTAPDGRRWLGRLIEAGQVAALKVALGLSDTAQAVGDGAVAARMILEDAASIALSEGLWLRRAKVMDRWRIEVVGAASQRQTFVQLGGFVEIINYQPRVFLPVDRFEVLTAVLARWPAQTILPAAA